MVKHAGRKKTRNDDGCSSDDSGVSDEISSFSSDSHEDSSQEEHDKSDSQNAREPNADSQRKRPDDEPLQPSKPRVSPWKEINRIKSVQKEAEKAKYKAATMLDFEDNETLQAPKALRLLEKARRR